MIYIVAPISFLHPVVHTQESELGCQQCATILRIWVVGSQKRFPEMLDEKLQKQVEWRKKKGVVFPVI